MAINFSKLKDPKLQMLDKLTFGKLKDCRVCDVIEDHYEYLIWAEKQGFVKFSQEVTDCILEQAYFEKWVAPDAEQGDPRDIFEISSNRQNGIFDDDIPF